MTDKIGKEDKYLMTSVNKTLEILDLLSVRNGLRAVDIGNALNINKASIFKMLYTLEKNKYINKTKNGEYVLGLKFAHYGTIALDSHNILDIVIPYLQELRDKHNETTHLGMLDDDLNVVFAVRESSKASIQMISKVGARTPFYVTAMGKVLVAFNFDEKMEKKVREYKLIRFTNNTITDYDSLIKKLNEIKEQGYGEDMEENEEGLVCYAAPVKDIKGDVIAAISISGPAYRMKANKECLIDSIKETAQKVSAALGYQS
ncbi:MAG: IclR family transcriptional regulator [Sedimentibacter sp.]